MNAPLRGHKGTPFEGGVRVPAFIVDFTPDQRYLSVQEPAVSAAATTSIDNDGGMESNSDADGEEGSRAADAETAPVEQVALDSTLTHRRPEPTKPVSVQYSRVYHGLMHMSDWLPTLLSYAGIAKDRYPTGLDGHDFSLALRYADYEDAVSTADICKGETVHQLSLTLVQLVLKDGPFE
jgi:hypothetical protein